MIDLFVGTHRLSSHARVEAFVIQTDLKTKVLLLVLHFVLLHSGSKPTMLRWVQFMVNLILLWVQFEVNSNCM